MTPALLHHAQGHDQGGCLAWLVYRYLGLKFVSQSWFNLDATWAVSLTFVGGLSLALSVANQH